MAHEHYTNSIPSKLAGLVVGLIGSGLIFLSDTIQNSQIEKRPDQRTPLSIPPKYALHLKNNTIK